MIHNEKVAEMLAEHLSSSSKGKGICQQNNQAMRQENKKCPCNPVSKQPLQAEREPLKWNNSIGVISDFHFEFCWSVNSDVILIPKCESRVSELRKSVFRIEKSLIRIKKL